MTWPKSLGLCLLVATVAGCGASGRASVPVGVGARPGLSPRGTDPRSGGCESVVRCGRHPAGGRRDRAHRRPRRAGGRPGRKRQGRNRGVRAVNYTSYQPEPNSFILEIPNVDLSKLPADVPMAGAGWNPIKISGLPSHHGSSHARLEFSGASAMEARVVPEGSALAVYLTPVAGQTSLLPEAPAAATGPFRLR